MTKLNFTPKLFTVKTKSGDNVFSWDLLTVDGETPRETVYFLHKNDAPSFNDSDQIVKAIDNEEWNITEVDEDIVKNYSIDISIFDTAGESYSEIKEKLVELC